MSTTYQHVEIDRRENALILRVTIARLTDYEVAVALGKEFRTITDEDPADKIIVDMGALEFMTSVGYGPFVDLRSRTQAEQKRLVLCNLSEFVYDVFDKTRLLINPQSTGSRFEHAADVDAAMAMLG